VHSDEKLVEMFQDGDESCFDDLFERYRSQIYAYLYRTTADKEASLDLLQETFIAAYSALDRWQPRAKFSTWLYTIATNKLRSHVRKEGRRLMTKPLETRDVFLDSPYEIPIASKGLNPEETYSKDIAEKRFAEEVKNLPSQQRKVFVLRLQNGLKLSEISKVLGLAEGTVKAHLFKAVSHLHRALAGLEYPGKFAFTEGSDE